jgi:hypothetical protein
MTGAWILGGGAWAICCGSSAVYLLAFNVPAFWLRWRGFDLGFQWGEKIAEGFGRFAWQTWISRLRIVGTALAFAVLAGFLFVTFYQGGPWIMGAAVFLGALLTFRFFPVLASVVNLYAFLCIGGVLLTLGRGF